jgi:hypothetical protein
MVAQFTSLVQSIAAKGRVSAEDALALRRAAYADGGISRQEAEMLVALDGKTGSDDAEWIAFFLESLTDYLVMQEAPVGYISPENARWLIACAGGDAGAKSSTMLELLIRIMEKATSCPPALAAFALDQVKNAVLTGTGPLARGGALQAGTINAAEVELLRRILWAGAGSGHAGISREEAEVLFELDEATRGAANDPSWPDLFAKCVANAVLCASGYQPPSREVALARAAWLDEKPASGGGIFSRMFSGGLSGILNAYTVNDMETAMAARNAEKAAAEAAALSIDPSEADWLVERIERSGDISESEMALLRFIAREASGIHPNLKKLIDKAA